MTRSRLRLRRGLLGLLVAGVLLAGCGQSATEDAAPPTPTVVPDTTPATSSAGTSSPGSAVPVPEVLDFTATTVDGEAFAGETLAGRPVVLWFWAPWCPVCRSQAPTVRELSSSYDGRLGVVGIGSLDSGSAIEDFAEGAPGPVHLSDPEGELWKRFGIVEQSSFVVLDAAGEEVLRTGYDEDEDLRAVVERLVG